MDFVAIIEWICNVGTNTYIAAFAQNNAILISPIAGVFFVWFRNHAKKTKATWDDDLVKSFTDKYNRFSNPNDVEPPKPGT
jgi:hypothetical protein